MELLVRGRIDTTDADIRTSLPVGVPPSPHTERPLEASSPLSAKAPQPLSAMERRLRLVIESAPVGLTVTNPSGSVLAANRTALAVFGIERLDAIVGKKLDTVIDTADRDRFAAFVTGVCGGMVSSVEYEVVRPDGSRRAMETHGVPIATGDGDAAACLAATWDVTESRGAVAGLRQLESKCALLESERDGLKAAVDAAKREAVRAEAHALAEPQRIDKAVRDAEDRLRSTLNEAEDRHAQLAAQWTVERETLTMKLRDADQRQAALVHELTVEREDRRTILEEVERKYLQPLNAAIEECTRLEETLQAVREQQEATLAASRTEQDRFAQTIEELHNSYDALVSEQAAARAEFETALQAERSRSTTLLHEREQWRQALADIMRTVNETGEQMQRLFDAGGQRGLVPADSPSDQVITAQQMDRPSAADTPPQAQQEDSWQF